MQSESFGFFEKKKKKKTIFYDIEPKSKRSLQIQNTPLHSITSVFAYFDFLGLSEPVDWLFMEIPNEYLNMSGRARWTFSDPSVFPQKSPHTSIYAVFTKMYFILSPKKVNSPPTTRVLQKTAKPRGNY